MIFGPGVDIGDAAWRPCGLLPVRPSSKAQRKLLGLRRRCQAYLSPISDLMLPRQAGDLVPHRLHQIGPEISLARVELLVQRHLLGPVLRQMLEEVLARPR